MNTLAPLSPDLKKARVDALRFRLKEQAVSFGSASDFWRTGVASLDGQAATRICTGHMMELVERIPGAGTQLVLEGLLREAVEKKEGLGLIDAADGFDPASVEEKKRSFLFWVRCSEPRQALPAADVLLRDGNLSLIVLDLRGTGASAMKGMPSSMWYRLQRLVEHQRMGLVVLTGSPLVPSATRRLELSGCFQLQDLDVRRAMLASRLKCEVLRKHANGDLGAERS